MKFNSPVFAQASGSIGGTVYSHNKGGQYIRNRSKPTNPNTPFQVAVRANFTQLATRWATFLTPAQRLGWATYAANVPLLNTLGASRPISALAMYQRCNGLILNAGLPLVDDAPLTFTLATFTPPVITVVGLTGVVSIAFTNTDDWAVTTGGAMVIQASTTQNASINFFKGPFQTKKVILGDTTTPPTSPSTFTIAHPIPSDLKIFFRVNVVDSDGRIGTPIILSADVA